MSSTCMERSCTKIPKRIRLRKNLINIALCMHGIHAFIKQEIFEVGYVRGSEARRHNRKAFHVDLITGHMGIKSTSHRGCFERYNKGYLVER